MKKILFACCLAIVSSAHAQQHTIEKIWETDSVIAIPESVLPDAGSGILYVSLIDGGAWSPDGKGGVGKLSVDGKLNDTSWIRGLHAPKGMGIYGNRLYVADITEVVVIDIKKGSVEKKIVIDSAQALNDITIDSKGIVYVSDSRGGTVYRIKNDVAMLYLQDLKGINGLKAIGKDLFILSGKNFVKADKRKTITKVADLQQGGDGIEPVGNGDFIVTSWSGYMYYVTADGTTEVLLDTHLDKVNAADIGYDASKRIIYVPTFNAKTVAAYRLK
ncbi:MAG: ATP-binding protein [Chitinophagaceae bacterium]|nr:ATP-binding protein [Chitinophagaceae bacterium]